MRKAISMRLLLMATVTVTSVLLMPSLAHAAVVLDFQPPSAPPGKRVKGTTRGAGMQGITSGRVVVLLAPSNRIADVARDPSDPRLVKFGVMTADESDVGLFVGMVPDIAVGSYIAVAYCRECAEDGAVFTIGEFTVTGPALPDTGVSSLAWLIGFSLIVAGGFLSSAGRSGRKANLNWRSRPSV